MLNHFSSNTKIEDIEGNSNICGSMLQKMTQSCLNWPDKMVPISEYHTHGWTDHLDAKVAAIYIWYYGS